MGNRKISLGIILIIIGILMLLDNIFQVEIFSFSLFWPTAIFVLGAIFEVSCFVGKKNPGLLVPGGILTTYGALFIFEAITRWKFSGYTWPIYELGVAVGLFQLYIFGGRKKGLLWPVCILAILASISFAAMLYRGFLYFLDSGVVVSVIIIAIGIGIIFHHFKGKKSKT